MRDAGSVIGAAQLPDLAAILEAQARIAPHVHRTPVMTCRALDAQVGARLFFKCENFQRVGAFKARGAVNAVFALADDVASRGVVTHSSGNHGAALAFAAARRGIAAAVVMPDNTSRTKQGNVRGFGAKIHFCAPDAAAREALCAQVRAETGATLIHPYDNFDVVAGQGSAAVELLEDVPDLDVAIAPIGGGGLISGTSIAAKALRPGIRVFGAEPVNADDAWRGFRSGIVEPVATTTTIADGLRSPLAPRTLAAIRANVDAIGLASEAAIVHAMRLIMDRMKIVIEPSSAVALACLIERTLEAPGARIGILLSGGNADLDHLPWTGGLS